ncbi:MAG: hypothetical protein ACJZ37_02530 [Candidatus Poseidoniales archaeon]|uniref:Uncharacterized protein n=1 Tax=Marine Group III euryarchaeote CG-Epi6 TaxID=1889000 RepID=A0A1J5T105_9ARCH|nr:MAG: hypothetical protein BEU03_01665 [Marine Group III euryarchaeote CG-Epi6]|tara:strand:+ start:2864 stop:3280 length:417 start_codon:yes stop_codon:yes gene_type:complete
MSDEELGSEIPDFIKKYVPGITRGLSWAKYSKEKSKGTEIKVDAYNESKEKGYQEAIEVSQEHSEKIFEEKKTAMWLEAQKLTNVAKEIASNVNSQETKEDREKILNSAKDAARNAGLQGAIAAGWEKGWNEGIASKS